MVRLLNLGPAKHEKVAIYVVNQRIANVRFTFTKGFNAIYEKKENEGAVAPVSSISPLWRTVYHTAL